MEILSPGSLQSWPKMLCKRSRVWSFYDSNLSVSSGHRSDMFLILIEKALLCFSSSVVNWASDLVQIWWFDDDLMSIWWLWYFHLQELCLNIIPTFANLIDYPSMKNALIPRIKNACLQTSSLAVSCDIWSLKFRTLKNYSTVLHLSGF